MTTMMMTIMYILYIVCWVDEEDELIALREDQNYFFFFVLTILFLFFQACWCMCLLNINTAHQMMNKKPLC